MLYIVVKESGFSLTTIFVFEQNVVFWRSVVNEMTISLTTLRWDGVEQEKGNALSYPNRANWVRHGYFGVSIPRQRAI